MALMNEEYGGRDGRFWLISAKSGWHEKKTHPLCLHESYNMHLCNMRKITCRWVYFCQGALFSPTQPLCLSSLFRSIKPVSVSTLWQEYRRAKEGVTLIQVYPNVRWTIHAIRLSSARRNWSIFGGEDRCRRIAQFRFVFFTTSGLRNETFILFLHRNLIADLRVAAMKIIETQVDPLCVLFLKSLAWPARQLLGIKGSIGCRSEEL